MRNFVSFLHAFFQSGEDEKPTCPLGPLRTELGGSVPLYSLICVEV